MALTGGRTGGVKKRPIENRKKTDNDRPKNNPFGKPQSFNTEKMKNITDIFINGQRLSTFRELELTEQIGEHGSFAIDIDIAELESRGAHALDASRFFLGRPLVIAFGAENATEFLGIIDDIALKKRQGHEGVITLRGKSKTIKLDGLPGNRSWLNKSLQDIVKEITEKSGVEAQIQPNYKGSLEYTVRYQESNWDFLRRLARTYGEPLEYDGTKLKFGGTQPTNPVALEYGNHLQNISVGIKAKPANYSMFSYNAEQDALYESDAKNQSAGLNELGLSALDSSLQLYQNDAHAHTEVRTKDKGAIEGYVANKQAQAVADLQVLEADCSVQGLKLGSVINVKSAL